MKQFRVEPVAQAEFEEAARWYEGERAGLGDDFVSEIDRVLRDIESTDHFFTAPIATVQGGVVRRELVKRFPYVVVFVETADERRVVMIRRGSSNPARWRSRL